MANLKNILMTCKRLFNKYDEKYWGQQFHLIIYQSKNEQEMAQRVLDLPWEGPASLPALIISTANGHNIGALEEGKVNMAFKTLRDELFFTARFVAGSDNED